MSINIIQDESITKTELINILMKYEDKDKVKNNSITGYCNDIRNYEWLIDKFINENFIGRSLGEKYHSLILNLDKPKTCLYCGGKVKYIGYGEYRKYCCNSCQLKYQSEQLSKIADPQFLIGYYNRQLKGFDRVKRIIFEKFDLKVNKSEAYVLIKEYYIEGNQSTFKCKYCGKKEIITNCNCLEIKAKKLKEERERIQKLKRKSSNKIIENNIEKFKKAQIAEDKRLKIQKKKELMIQKDKMKLIKKLVDVLNYNSISIKELSLINTNKLLHSKEYYNIICKYTDFLNEDCTLNERIYCIKNGITKKKTCEFCGSTILYENYKYKKYCSSVCDSNSRKGKGNPCHKQSEKTKMLSRQKQSKTIKEKIFKGEFTPCVTNSWANSRVRIKTKLDIENVKSFRSTWEALFWLLNNKLEYEKIRILYEYKGDTHNYITDFQDYVNKIIYEVKPNIHIVKDEKVKIKEKYAKMWCNDNGWTFKYIDEDWFRLNIHKIKNVDINEYFNDEDYNKLKLSIKKLGSESNEN